MLCVTNGDCAAVRIERLGLPCHVLPWGDVLHEGPVPSGLSLDELREVRARFISERGWGGFDEAMEDFARRDSALAGFGDHEEVVLFFEHDLYDQLQLIQLLDWFGRREFGLTRLSLVQASEYLGALAPDRLRALFENRHEVSGRELNLGREAWESFTSSEPTQIFALLRQDTTALPFLGDALLRHLQEFPSVKNGLSRSETQALAEISAGRNVLREAFIAAHQECEDSIFLGDAVFAWYLERLSSVREPLLLFEGGGGIQAPRAPDGASEFWESRAEVTGSGRAVLEGREDHVELNGVDRWLGGVHLSGEARWRWDETTRRLR